MCTSRGAQTTNFSLDLLGRYICNGLDEALLSADADPRPDLGRPFARPDARPFDTIILGGGSFGATLAYRLLVNDVTRSHRILVLEAGPFLLPEHQQNLPVIGLGTPEHPSSIAALHAMPAPEREAWRKEVWDIPWHSSTPFMGLAYCVGGRSLYWSGWSPVPLASELPAGGAAPSPWPPSWPKETVHALQSHYFAQAAREMGVTEPNDFLYSPLHDALRQRLAAGVDRIEDACALGELPDHSAVLFQGAPASDRELGDWLGLARGPLPSRQELLNLLKLEAPLAVQTESRPGRLPGNRWSPVPALIRAVRTAELEAGHDDVDKRLMLVPFCRVLNLTRMGSAVTAVQTERGPIPVAPSANVIIALGTIESTRLALNAFRGIPSYSLIGRNLMAHLRSSLTMRIPRGSLPGLEPTPAELETGPQISALFVRGMHSGLHRTGSFHLQITACGLNPREPGSEALMWQQIPDIDLVGAMHAADDSSVIITIRAIGEMEPQSPSNRVQLDPHLDADDRGVTRAFVTLAPSANDSELWTAMDRASDQVAWVLAGGRPFEVLQGRRFVPVKPGDSLHDIVAYAPRSDFNGRRDGLGTTHHEAGTLWMGDSELGSVTDALGRFHHLGNVYAAGPALFPTNGSANPMLTGIALASRLADHLIAPLPAATAEPGFSPLFDGTDQTFNRWLFVGEGSFTRVGRALVAYPGHDLGLLYYPQPFSDFVLRLDFLLAHPRRRHNDNSGVFLRFQDPLLPVPDRSDPEIHYPYVNQAYVAVDTGFEVQIDEEARGQPDGLMQHHTGAIYGIAGFGTAPGQQNYHNTQRLQAGRWSQLEIKVLGQRYTVFLNGEACTDFVNGDQFRGQAPGYIGLQAHTGHVAFANIRIQEL